ncbi:hypothetical protein ABPG77_000809 [Micractinium sp. CCAP 211/92]
MQRSLGASRHTVQASKPRAAALRQPGRRSGLAVLAIAAPVRDEVSSAQQQQQSGDSLTSAAVAAAASRGRVVLESPEELKSTWEHRGWTFGACALLAATLAQGLAQVDSLGSAAGAGAAVLAAYYMADVGTAFYHWGVDNYGDGNTPVFGGQIAAFQGHHQRPWTITEREFCNNMHKLFRPASFFAAGLAGMAAAGAPALWDIWSSSFLFLCCMSQQFHAWSHMKKSELPGAIVALQDAGLLISRRDHGAHHKAPFNCKYSIVSGWCNPLLDGDCPENSVWMKLEKWIHEKYGVEPRGWYEPSEQWKEQERTVA